MGDIGDQRAALRKDRALWREDVVDAEFAQEPGFLGQGVVAAAGHRAGMPHSAGEAFLPASDHAGDDGLGEFRVQLIVTARFDIEHCRLAAWIVAECERELRRGKVDVNVLAARNQRSRAPTCHAQVGGDRRREVAGVGKYRDRALAQGFFRMVATQRAADADAIPRIRDAETVRPEDVDAVRLCHRANLARIVRGQFLGDDKNLVQFGVHPQQLRDAVARSRRRQVDDAAVESVAVVDALEDIVVHGHSADWRLQPLAAPSGRRAEDDVAAGIVMANRRDLARFAAHDVEHADAIVAGGDLRQRFDADVILESADACGLHARFRAEKDAGCGWAFMLPPPYSDVRRSGRVRRSSSTHRPPWRKE